MVCLVSLDEVLPTHLQELRRGTVAVASLIALEEPGYGYGLLQTLAAAGFSVDGNTLYPLLRRLEDQGLLTSEWDTSASKPRKFYRTSDLGRDVRAALLDDLTALTNAFTALQSDRPAGDPPRRTRS
jgi:DNA-binding PadR family transcriptional regulator